MTAITCTAFSHSTMARLVGPAHEGNKARHVLGWRLRLDAVAQVEDEGSGREVRDDLGHTALQRRPTREQKQRVEIALHDGVPWQLLCQELERQRPIAADPINTRLARVVAHKWPSTARKTNHRHRWMALLEPTHQATRWLDDPMAKLIVGQIARPAIENLHEIGTGIDLSAQIFNRDVLEQADQPFKTLRISIGPQPRVCLIDTALSSHHVGCHRPRRTAEPDERRCPRKILAHPRNGLEHALELGPSRARVQASKFRRGADPFKPRALAFDKAHGLIERVGHNKDIGKYDGSIEVEATDRLQGHFGGENGRATW